MAFTITEAFVKQYKANVLMLSQQKGSRLRDKVRVEDVNGDVHFFERLAKTAAVKKTVRHGDTPLVPSDHSRRRVSMVDYEWADLVDRQDKIRILIDPGSEYAQNAAWAISRSVDDEIIAALGGDAFSGVDGGTTVALPAGQKIAVAAASMTLAKMLSAKEILDKSDVDPDEPRYMLTSPVEITNLLNTTEVKSADYNTVKALAQGQINSFLGFDFVLSNRLLLDGSGNRLCYAWARQGMGLAVGKDISTEMDYRADKSYALQVYVCATHGATRIEDEKVVQIACTP